MPERGQQAGFFSPNFLELSEICQKPFFVLLFSASGSSLFLLGNSRSIQKPSFFVYSFVSFTR